MELKEITITASVSRNYQKAEFSATATVESLRDIEELKELCKNNANELLDTLCPKSEASNSGADLNEQPVRRTIVNSTPTQPNNTRPTFVKKRPGDCKIGETYSFTGVIYKLCHSEAKNDTYWKIQDESKIDAEHPKYRKDGLNQQ